jgi:hypothetical protein
MAVVNKMELGRELFKTIAQINEQIEVVSKSAEELNVKPYNLLDDRGNFVLSPLLAAKAQCLHALALINQRD